MRLLEEAEILHIFICIVRVGGRYQEAQLNNSDAPKINFKYKIFSGIFPFLIFHILLEKSTSV